MLPIAQDSPIALAAARAGPVLLFGFCPDISPSSLAVPVILDPPALY